MLSSHPTGMTLIEVLVVLIILAILFGFAIPAYWWSDQHLLDASRYQLLSSLNYARNSAITQSEHVIICASSNRSSCSGSLNWQSGWIVFADSNQNRERDKNEPVLLQQHRPDSRIAIMSSQYRSRIRFSPLGDSLGSNTTFAFCQNQTAGTDHYLILSNQGRMRLSNTPPKPNNRYCP